jgi:hypothetical protein
MVQVHESLFSKHSYPKQALWIYFIPLNLFLLLLPMSVSVDLFLFLYFQDDLEYRCVLVLQEAFVGYDQTIANDVGLASLDFGATPSLSLISSFLIRSFLVWPHIQRNIRISATLIFSTRCPFVAQHSAPYIITGLIVVL